MSIPTKKFVRLIKDLPLDPAHRCLKGTVWEVVMPPKEEGKGMKTWIQSAADRPVALLRHEWEECLAPCPHCGAAGHVVPAVKRGLFIAQCPGQAACGAWPMTEPMASEDEAAAAWNRGEFQQATPAQLAHAE